MKKTTLARTLGAIVLFFVAFSAWSLEITLESAAQYALGNNRLLLAQYAQQQTLDRERRSGWNEFLPELYAGTGLSRYNDPPMGYEQWYYAVTVGGALDLSAVNGFNITTSRQAWEQGLISLEELEHRVVRDARKAFLALLLLRDTITIYENLLVTAEARYQRAARRFELGDARKVDMLSFQVAWQNLIPTLTDLKNTYEVFQLEFRRQLGLSSDEPITLVGEIEAFEESFDAPSLIADRLGERFDVRSANLLLNQLDTEKGRRISQTMTPVFTFSYDYSPALGDPFGTTGDWGDHTGQLNLGMVLPLDGFIPNSRRNLSVREVNDQIEAAELRLADTLQAGAIAIESAVLNLNKSVDAMRSLELNVQLAEESYDLVSRSYDVGEADYIQVQTADDDLNTARITLLNEKYNYAAALQDLEYALALDLNVDPIQITEDGMNE